MDMPQTTDQHRSAEDVLTEPPTYVDGCLEVPRTIGFGAGITL